ncbi:zcchc14 family protein [Megaselia abdita]
MICKEDIIQWFQKLESYKRIDTMCTLLNMCLPFELRFLGTCLEELGRRDSQDLRGVELRVNNPNDLKADFATFQTGEPTDIKVRRRMALYLALMRACNRTCVAELFKTLECWGNRDFDKFTDEDALQELLLVYTMGNNHPVFSFEQKMKCGEIFTKISQNELVVDKDPIVTVTENYEVQQQSHLQQPQVNQQQQQQHQQQQQQQQIIHQQTTAHPIYSPEFLHHIHSSGPPTHHPIQLLPPNTIPVGYHQAFTTQHHPPQAASPLLSQQSSPANSRSTSPSRSSGGGSSAGGQQQQLRNIQQQRTGMRNVRRSSNDTTPPPPLPQQQQILDIITANNSDVILSQNLKNHEEMESTHYSQLQQMIRNGYRANTSRQNKSGNVQHQQQQQPPPMQHPQQVIIQTQLHHPSAAYNASGLPYTLQNMSLNEIHSVDGNRSKHNVAGGSESCSSNGSAGESSPPETPTILSNNISNAGNAGNVRLKDPQYTKQMNFSRINGRPEKVGAGPTIIYAPPVSPQQVAAAGTYEMILAQNMLQPNPVVSNNNTLNSNASTASCNNNLGTNTVIIPSHPPPSLTSTQQFGASYPYPAAAVNRPPHQLLQHVTAPPGTFRLHNGENIYYPHYPVFLPAAPTQQQTIRSSPSQQPPHSLPANATTLPPQPQQQPQPTVSVSPSPVAATLVSPYSTIVPSSSVLLKSKPQISCYNCGSQNHTGRDCHEASMEEVTRGAVYKLDYSSGMGVNMNSSNSSNNNINSSSNNSNSNNNIGANTTSSTTTSSSSSSSSSTSCAPGNVVTTIDINSDTSSSTASSTSSSSSLLSTSNNK